MSDLSRSFQPWDDNFTKGLYLAGVEVPDDAEAPDGWVKWTVPGYEYVYAVNAGIGCLRRGFATGFGKMVFP